MLWRIEVRNKQDVVDAVGRHLMKSIYDLGIKSVSEVKMVQVYLIEGDVDENQIYLICEEILRDKVIQDYRVVDCNIEPHPLPEEPVYKVLEIAYNRGVMDPWEESIQKGIKDLGVRGAGSIKTGRKYLIKGKITAKQLNFIAEKLLYNKVIQHIVKDYSIFKKTPAARSFKLKIIEIINSSPEKLMQISKKGQLFLNLEEMLVIQRFFRQLQRSPTDCELETLAQTWSEHCCHKTIKSRIVYTQIDEDPQGPRIKKEIINNLLKDTIVKATKKLNKPWCVSVFEDNAGIIQFDRNYNICFKVETHNHPSALEPYGGAGTGIGGVIRDILGAGCGAKPIVNTDVFCFGMPDYPFNKLPPGTLHPKRVMQGVVAGVRDYGNRMGIPTASGAVLFDEKFVGNPLVYCGTAGIIPKDKCFKKVYPGDQVVLVGGKTGRDGIHGATFSSGELTAESEIISSGAVQIGNPITEKKVLDALLAARDLNLFNAVTDCGGGGLSSAVGEMGRNCGVRVYLDKVPLKYAGLNYTEIWISESQERMILSVPPKHVNRLLDVFKKENIEATVIGEFTKSKRLELFFQNKCVGDLEMEFLHNGLPQVEREAVWKKPDLPAPRKLVKQDLNKILLKILAHGNVCSKEWIIRQYDHEVQGSTVVKPLIGINNDGPGDAVVIKPLPHSKKGIIISCGINTRFGQIDPYWMAASCIDEALRQIVAVGGNLARVGILDNFSWGNTNNPERLGELVRACRACYDFSLGFGVPFISGKDSLNNEYTVKNKTITIPPTLLISAIAVMPDVGAAITADLKQPGNKIYIVGVTNDELGGSIYYDILGYMGSNLPKVDVKSARKNMQALSLAIEQGLVRSCHDLSDGGLSAACSEMAFAGGWGMEINLANVPITSSADSFRDEVILFSESNSRFIVEVALKQEKAFKRIMQGSCCVLIGRVMKNKCFKVYGRSGRIVINADIADLKHSWQKTLNWQ
ncbi:MAG: phosphoribosylformylglycinamidine synthase subunit PurL [Candidatus Omnitrophota bacterium]